MEETNNEEGVIILASSTEIPYNSDAIARF